MVFAVALTILAAASIGAQQLPWPEVGYTSQGTGFLVAPNGYVLTSLHVVQDAEAISVRVNDRVYPARTVASLEEHDAALLKIDASGLSVATLGDSTALQIGDTVYALGCPAGVCGTVTSGHVANLGVESTFADAGTIDNLAMLDLTITHGSSGGPLVDEDGRVVGITMGGIEGSGFGYAVLVEDLEGLLALAGAAVAAESPAPTASTAADVRMRLLPSVAYIESDMTRELSLPDGYSAPVSSSIPPFFPFDLPPSAASTGLSVTSGGQLAWALSQASTGLACGAEGVAPPAEWSGQQLAIRCRQSATPWQDSYGSRYERMRSLAVIRASSEAAARALASGLSAWVPTSDWATGAENESRREVVLHEASTQGGVDLTETLSIYHGHTRPMEGPAVLVHYVLVGRTGSLVMCFAGSTTVELAEPAGIFVACWVRVGSAICLTPSFNDCQDNWAPALDLDALRQEENAEGVRTFNEILGQL
jgi:hypothetical protein